MKHIQYTLGTVSVGIFVVAASVFFIIPVAFAHEGEADDDSSVSTTVSVSASSDSSGSVRADVGAEIKTRGDGSVDDDQGQSETPSVMDESERHDGSDDEDDDSSMETDDDADDDHGNDVSVRAVEVRGWDDAQKSEFLLKVKAHAEVASGKDLENFARGVLLKDDDIEDIELKDDEITLEYRAHGKILGFIPHAFTEVVTVKASDTAEERVKVRFPWYRFVLQSDVSAEEVAKTIRDTLDNDNVSFNPLATGGTVNVSIEGNARVFARVLESISNVLKTKHDTAKNSINNVR